MKQDILHRILFDEHRHWEAFVTKHGKNEIVPEGLMRPEGSRLFYAGMESLEYVWGIVLHYEQ